MDFPWTSNDMIEHSLKQSIILKSSCILKTKIMLVQTVHNGKRISIKKLNCQLKLHVNHLHVCVQC